MSQPPDLPPNSLPAKPTLPALSPALKTLLEDVPQAETALSMIAQNPALVAECRRALPAIQAAATQPASEAELMEVLGRRFALFPQPERSDAEWSAWWGDYFEALAGLPVAAVEAGMRAWVRDPDAEFMPKPGRLRELAERTPRAFGQVHTRLFRAVSEANATDARPASRDRTPADRERVGAMFEIFAASMRAKQQALEDGRPKPRFEQAEVDAGGLSAAMRELMARQGRKGG